MFFVNRKIIGCDRRVSRNLLIRSNYVLNREAPCPNFESCDSCIGATVVMQTSLYYR